MPEPPITENVDVADLDGRVQWWPNDRPDGPRYVWFELEDICTFWAYRNHAYQASKRRGFPALFHADDEIGIAYYPGGRFKPHIRTWEEVLNAEAPTNEPVG